MTVATPHPKLPGRFEALVGLMPPRAIADAAAHRRTVEMIDRLMRVPRLTKGQEAYMETLVQLAEAYEAEHHAIDASGVTGIEALAYLLAENAMTATDLAKLLGVHASMGSKVLNGERSLTAGHIRVLAERFRVEPGLFL